MKQTIRTSFLSGFVLVLLSAFFLSSCSQDKSSLGPPPQSLIPRSTASLSYIAQSYKVGEPVLALMSVAVNKMEIKQVTFTLTDKSSGSVIFSEVKKDSSITYLPGINSVGNNFMWEGTYICGMTMFPIPKSLANKDIEITAEAGPGGRASATFRVLP